MDRHVEWLRRRIIASVAIRTAETFAVVAMAAFAVMQWRTDAGPLTALFGSVVVAQLVAGARIGHAMRNNPLNYVFMRRYVDQPFAYRVTRFQGEEHAHPVAERLPGFVPVATIRDHDANPESIFDVYHDPSRVVTASVSRASGSVSLISSLTDGRILVTDARSMPPHECLVMNLAEGDSVDSIIATHYDAISARSDVVELASSAHQVVLDSRAIEYDSYVALGPILSPFLDLGPAGKSWLRLVARIKPAELSELPVRLGRDLSMSNARVSALAEAPAPVANPVAIPATPRVHSTLPTELSAPPVIAPQIAGPKMVAAEVVAPTVAAPSVAAPSVAGLEAVVLTQESAVTEASGLVTAEARITEAPAVALTQAPAARVPLDLAAAIASMATVPTIDVAVAPVPPVATEQVVTELAVAEPVPVALVTAEPVHAPLPHFIMQPPSASFAEAVRPAPDTAAALTETGAPWSRPTKHASNVDPVLVPDLDTALGRSEELSPTRPRLSAVLRANSGQDGSGSAGAPSRRQSR